MPSTASERKPLLPPPHPFTCRAFSIVRTLRSHHHGKPCRCRSGMGVVLNFVHHHHHHWYFAAGFTSPKAESMTGSRRPRPRSRARCPFLDAHDKLMPCALAMLWRACNICRSRPSCLSDCRMNRCNVLPVLVSAPCTRLHPGAGVGDVAFFVFSPHSLRQFPSRPLAGPVSRPGPGFAGATRGSASEAIGYRRRKTLRTT
jgi:hypothetical protein